MHSHHSHSGQFCKHASGNLEDVVLEAIHQGFDVYGLTEHVPRYRIQDLYPEEEGMSLPDLEIQFNAFLDEAHRLKSLYADKINLLIGLETEYITLLDIDNLQQCLRTHGERIEYIVGSIHHVNGLPIDFDFDTFQKALRSLSCETEKETQEHFLCRYFEAQYDVLQHVKPEVVGHFDLCRLFTPSLRLDDYPAARKLAERNIAYAVGYGALFEVNAAAFRKKWDTAYPAGDVVEIILKHGGRFTLSDDSHGPHAVGLNYDRVAKYLRSVNVAELWYLQSSMNVNAAGRKTQSVRLEGDWWDHTFWHGRLHSRDFGE
ncbi:Polymerase/histidinol phosphatase-like protein [Desarmillaria tabescens]|uniref:Histidinol-phosphatase n=1 Tax=Armillaria tabescens TaxID=1929756 RepID=A0AA39NPF7_ARMTA|nr:Polymerase/histidinol phosphatase-like protein [Desarmillaria tabescens]KAK0469371.1 Polymerase/histidinol phosphatase-like protein [Desarmillaria tabescens]